MANFSKERGILKIRFVLSCALVFLLLPFGRAYAQMPQLPPNADMPSNMKQYFLILVSEGEVKTAQTQAQHDELMKKHLAYVRNQVEARKYLVVGPALDGGHFGGIVVVNVASADDARQLAGNDPLVQSGRASFEVHPVMLPDLSPVRIIYSQPGK